MYLSIIEKVLIISLSFMEVPTFKKVKLNLLIYLCQGRK